MTLIELITADFEVGHQHKSVSSASLMFCSCAYCPGTHPNEMPIALP